MCNKCYFCTRHPKLGVCLLIQPIRLTNLTRSRKGAWKESKYIPKGHRVILRSVFR